MLVMFSHPPSHLSMSVCLSVFPIHPSIHLSIRREWGFDGNPIPALGNLWIHHCHQPVYMKLAILGRDGVESYLRSSSDSNSSNCKSFNLLFPIFSKYYSTLFTSLNFLISNKSHVTHILSKVNITKMTLSYFPS